MELKDQIRIARVSAGLSQNELADLLAISKQSIIWWEKGEHRPKMARIRQIEDALGIRFDLTERGNAKPPATGGHTSPSVDPENLRIAVALSRLPKEHRDAIKKLLFIGEAKMLGTNSHASENLGKEDSLIEAAETPAADIIDIDSATPAAEFNYVEKRKKNDESSTEISTTSTKPERRRRTGK